MRTILLLFVALGVSALAADTAVDEIHSAATRALTTFRQLAMAGKSQVVGIDSSSEMQSAALGEPISLYMVRLDELRTYQAGADPNPLLKKLDRVVYPVLIKEQVRSSITMEKVRNEWVATAYGGANFIQALTKTIKQSATATGLPASSYFAVQVLALRVTFIAHRSDNKLMFTPILDDPALKLTAGKTVPAEEALAALVPIAQHYNGQPL